MLFLIRFCALAFVAFFTLASAQNSNCARRFMEVSMDVHRMLANHFPKPKFLEVHCSVASTNMVYGSITQELFLSDVLESPLRNLVHPVVDESHIRALVAHEIGHAYLYDFLESTKLQPMFQTIAEFREKYRQDPLFEPKTYLEEARTVYAVQKFIHAMKPTAALHELFADLVAALTYENPDLIPDLSCQLGLNDDEQRRRYREPHCYCGKEGEVQNEDDYYTTPHIRLCHAGHFIWSKIEDLRSQNRAVDQRGSILKKLAIVFSDLMKDLVEQGSEPPIREYNDWVIQEVDKVL